MKVLSIGTDRKLFEGISAVKTRSMDYASKMEELHIIVFSLKKQNLTATKIGNLYIYPTNSISRMNYVFDAVKIGSNIISKNNFRLTQSVISTQDPFETGWVGYRLKKKFDIPLQLQIHTDFLSPYFKNNFLNRIRIILANFLVPRADGLRVVSSIIESSLKEKFKNINARLDVLPIFVDVNGIESAVETSEQAIQNTLFKKNILMFSRLTKEKRFDVALQTVKKVFDVIPDVGLVIFGSGPEKENIEKMIKELGLQDRVSLKGWVESNEIWSSFFSKLSDVFLLTSEHEGYGMTLIEAGSAGCPIVTTKVGIAKTDLFKSGENSFVCPVGDVECLSKSLIDLITDESKRKLFKDRMRDSIKSTTYSKQEYTEKYVALLESLLVKI